MQRFRDLLAARAQRRSVRRHAAFERYYLRREIKAHRADLDQWAADCATLQELPTQEVSR